ncbi:hypothetical protein PAMA_014473 [Pampus argenteus]
MVKEEELKCGTCITFCFCLRYFQKVELEGLNFWRSYAAEMAKRAVLYLLFLLDAFPKALTDLIQTQQTVMSTVGQNASFDCQLLQLRDVLQVTWKKLSPEGIKRTLATYNKYYGSTVYADFQGKVEFKDAGLQSCSIVIREVKEQDEGCYLCVFYTYPDGVLTGTTCLQLYELHEPILQISESNSAEETVVSCSATGRPAPTVTLTVSHQGLNLSNSSTVSVTNTNSTVTVTTTAVLSGFHGYSTQVGCAARLLSVPEIQVFKTIPAVKESSADDFDEESGGKNFTLILSLSLAFVSAAVIALLMFIYRKSKLNFQLNICLFMTPVSHNQYGN